MTSGRTREAVAVLRDERSLIATVDELLISGFEISDISVFGGVRPGVKYNDMTDMTDDPDAPVAGFVDEPSRTEAKAAIIAGLLYIGAVGTAAMVFASGGTLVSAVAGAIVVGCLGVFIGCVIAGRLDRRHADYVDRQIASGGLPLWIQTADHRSERRGIVRLTGRDLADQNRS